MSNRIVLELLAESFCPEDARVRVMVEVDGERHVTHTGDMRSHGGVWLKGLVDEALGRALTVWKQIEGRAPAEAMELRLWEDTVALCWEEKGARHHIKRPHVGLMRTYADLMAVINELLEEFAADPDGSAMLAAGKNE